MSTTDPSRSSPAAFALDDFAQWAPTAGEALLLLFPIPVLTPTTESRLRGALNVPEADRADRFHQLRDRHTCVLTRALLRHVLGRWTGQAPAAIALRYGEHGKPALAADDGRHFNVAHSYGVAAIALAAGAPVGIDVEAVAPARATPDTAQCFAAHERALLRDCPQDRYAELFFRLWTLKEAYLKARGEGLSIALDAFEFTPALDAEAIGFHSRLGDDASDWRFHSGLAFASHRWALALDARRCPGAVRVVEIDRPLHLLGLQD